MDQNDSCYYNGYTPFSQEEPGANMRIYIWLLWFAVYTVFIIEGRSSYSFVPFLQYLVEPPPPTMFVYLHTETYTHTYLYTHTKIQKYYFDLKIMKAISSHSQEMPLPPTPTPQSYWTCPQYTHHRREQKFLTGNFILTYWGNVLDYMLSVFQFQKSTQTNKTACTMVTLKFS